MHLKDQLRNLGTSGFKGALTKIIEVAIVACVLFIPKYMMDLFSLTPSFLAAKRLTLYDGAILLCITAVTSIWITYSIMRNRSPRITDMIDPTTGARNLLAFDEQLKLAMEDAKRSKQPLLLVIFDIDGFRQLNSRVGNDAANTVLAQVKFLLQPRAPGLIFRYPANFRPTTENVYYSYSGDEFMVISPNTSIKGGTDPGTNREVSSGFVMTHRLQDNVWSTNFAELVEKREEEKQEMKITVSAGISEAITSLSSDDTADGLRRRAELALNEAKRSNKKEGLDDDKGFRGTIVVWDRTLQADLGDVSLRRDKEAT